MQFSIFFIIPFIQPIFRIYLFFFNDFTKYQEPVDDANNLTRVLINIIKRIIKAYRSFNSSISKKKDQRSKYNLLLPPLKVQLQQIKPGKACVYIYFLLKKRNCPTFTTILSNRNHFSFQLDKKRKEKRKKTTLARRVQAYFTGRNDLIAAQNRCPTLFTFRIRMYGFYFTR